MIGFGTPPPRVSAVDSIAGQQDQAPIAPSTRAREVL